MLSFADVGLTSNHEDGGVEVYSAAQHEAMYVNRKRRWRSLLVGVDDDDEYDDDGDDDDDDDDGR